jgi:altronate hydrolase
MLKSNAIQINIIDNVAIVAQKITDGETVIVGGEISVLAAENIAAGHKVALKLIGRGSKVYRYGEAIAEATEDINPGKWVHVHNTKAYPR